MSALNTTDENMQQDIRKILEASHYNPFSVLGKHPASNDTQQEIVRVFLPRAKEVFINSGKLDAQNVALVRSNKTDIFEWQGKKGEMPDKYQIIWRDSDGRLHQTHDPYNFPAQLSDFDIHLFGEGKHWHAYRFLGAHSHIVDNVNGTLFATWAPSAERVSVTGDFNHWDGRCHPMRSLGNSGLWELFIPDVESGALYKFEIRNRDNHTIHLKSDPYGQSFELRPSTAAIVPAESKYSWTDGSWMEQRKNTDWLHSPMSVYEVHLGSWQQDEHGRFLSYTELAHKLADYVEYMGFTHIELMPIAEHPLDASWGYQTIGAYAPSSRFGAPDEFRYFVDHLHARGIGVFIDWVPAHFPKDEHGLARFDGSALYEHEDPRKGEHRDWGTLIFNYGRNEVKNYLLSNAVYWLEEFHIDGLRVDAVASMIYLDYSREEGDWVPNMYGGNENLEALDFLRHLNEVTHGLEDGSVTIAEESTSWPQVSRPTWLGGLGFSMKWNMGWMNDTLEYLQQDPIHRQYHHDQLTFGLLYAFTENFVLPFSHDEVVHGKGSMLYKMPGDEWQQFANLRLLYTYMFTYPGKKLLFMGTEFAQGREWDHSQSLDWYVLDYELHKGMQSLVKDLNKTYKDQSALYQYDFDSRGFEWVDCHDSSQSILIYIRKHENEFIIVALNFTPIPREGYRIGVPERGTYQEILNSDSSHYGGSNMGNSGEITTEDIPWMNRPYSINLTLPPLAGVVLRYTS